MKIFKTLLLVFFLLTMILHIHGQENSVVPKRTPELEAIKQTERLQQELDLNQEQVNQVYEINLHYARERQISNKRSEALERMKNKNSEINQVLNSEQNEKLQSKRYERTYLEKNTLNRNQSINSTGLRPTSNFHSNQTYRVPPSTKTNIRNNFRPVNPNFRSTNPSGNTTRRSTTTVPSSNQLQHNQASPRSLNNLPNPSRRNETGIPPTINSSGSRFQTAPVYTPGRTQTPSNSNRK